MSFNEIMNSALLYTLVGAGILFILIFCGVTFIKAYRHGIAVGMPKEKLRTAIISSAIYTIVPSISIVIGLFSLSAVIGVPWSWFRLSVVGAVTYELMAADMAATGAGYESIAALNAAGEEYTEAWLDEYAVDKVSFGEAYSPLLSSVLPLSNVVAGIEKGGAVSLRSLDDGRVLTFIFSDGRIAAVSEKP